MVMETPIIRKIINLGTSKGITLPASWLKNYEEEAGQQIDSVAIEVDGVLKVQPVIKKSKRKKKGIPARPEPATGIPLDSPQRDLSI